MAGSEHGKLGYAKSGHILRQLGRERTQRCIDEYEANPKFCLYCGEKIPFERRRAKFCNSSCSASYNNVGIVRNRPLPKTCSCGQTFFGINQYCPECIEKRVYNKKASIEAAKSDRARKRILIEQRGHRCEVCGLEEWRGKPIPIELDHIDGNSDNRSPENLRLICPNCHAQTQTYKGANAGKNSSRQQMRRRRYANGLTY